MINVLSYFFLTLLCISSVCVVLVQNTFFALLFLILSFFLTSIVLFLLELEFLGLILIIIYVGAVAVLLLFVLMMLETKLKDFSQNIFVYFPFGAFINGILLVELFYIISTNFNENVQHNNFTFNNYFNWYIVLDSLTDLEIYGQLLYTQYVLQVLVAGLILFLALVGVIFLITNPIKPPFKSQTSFCQLSRNYLNQNPSQILL
jgi:NADH-quinone oxidoreductase subunit J